MGNVSRPEVKKTRGIKRENVEGRERIKERDKERMAREIRKREREIIRIGEREKGERNKEKGEGEKRE